MKPTQKQEPVAWKRPVYMVEDGWDEFARAIEAKLKEKNT